MSSSAIFWYAGRFLFFGVRWGTASSIWLLDKLRPISPSSQWQPCPTEPAQCDLHSVPLIPQASATLHHGKMSSSSQTFACKIAQHQSQTCFSCNAIQGLDGAIHAQVNDLRFAPVLHTVKTFVEQHPLILTCHLCFIVVAGLLWSLQVWTSTFCSAHAMHLSAV